MTWDVSSALANGDEPWLRSPFRNPQYHAIALIFMSLLISELILQIPQKVLELHRWLVLLSIVFLTATFDLVYWLEVHHKTHLTQSILTLYWFTTVLYLFRFQWRFVPEGTFYDLLLGPLFLWVFLQMIVDGCYADLVGPPEQSDDIAELYALYFIPTLFIYPGLFHKDKMKYAVIFSLIIIPLCVGIICNRELMGFLVDHRTDVLNFTLIGRPWLIMGTAFIVIPIASFGGRTLFCTYSYTKKLLWKKRVTLPPVEKFEKYS